MCDLAPRSLRWINQRARRQAPYRRRAAATCGLSAMAGDPQFISRLRRHKARLVNRFRYWEFATDQGLLASPAPTQISRRQAIIG
jgi:hypothetical protein